MLSVSVIFVPAFWFPALTEITPCPLPIMVWAIADAPVPRKAPPEITPPES